MTSWILEPFLNSLILTHITEFISLTIIQQQNDNHQPDHNGRKGRCAWYSCRKQKLNIFKYTDKIIKTIEAWIRNGKEFWQQEKLLIQCHWRTYLSPSEQAEEGNDRDFKDNNSMHWKREICLKNHKNSLGFCLFSLFVFVFFSAVLWITWTEIYEGYNLTRTLQSLFKNVITALSVLRAILFI